MSPFLFALLVGFVSRLSSSLGASTELYCRQKHGSPGHYEIHLDFLRHPDADHFANLTFTQGDMATFSLTSPSVKPTCVDLSFNRLIVWPELNCSTSVHYLNLSSNRLSQWNLATFPELRVLDLSHNSLMSVDLNALLRLPRLEVLYLHGNLIHIFSDLRRSPSLKTVILSAQDWYALNNIDFGPYPIHMLISTATAAK
uniref:Toll-like receptor 9 n=1 Tax=Plectus sambesii TaxID=2011161 RepID=A0A914VFF0_9BILA